MYRKSALLLLLSIFFLLNGYSQSVVSGTVRDAATNETLVGVALYVEELKRGTSTDEAGKYSIRLPAGEFVIRFSYIGYTSMEKKVTITNKNSQSLNIKLAMESQELEEVVVTGRRQDANISEMLMSSQKLQMVTIKKIPALMGEVDVIKAIQLLPGVQAAAEGSSGFSVRGGSVDQNLILLDNATIYSASHMMGFFSVFNNDAVSEATLLKGDMPAVYGGRLSSVLDVEMKNEVPKKFSGSGGIGLISSRLMLEAPLFDDKTSVMIAGRRTYADLFIPLSGNDDLKDTYLYFYDLNAKITHKIDDKNRIYLSGYHGRDNFGMNNLMGFGFGNSSLTARWNHVFSEKLFSNLSLLGSQYNYAVDMEMKPYRMTLGAGMKDWTLKYDFSYLWNQKNTTKFGLSGTFHRFNQGELKNKGTDESLPVLIENTSLENRKGLEYGVYLSHEQSVTRKLSLKYGLRLSMFQNIGKELLFRFDENYNVIDSTQFANGKIFNTEVNLEPRLGLLYQLDKVSSVKASYSRTVQYAQMASNSNGGLPFDIWYPSNPNIKPQKCDQVAVGYFRNFLDNMLETSIEVYYKNMMNAIDFKDHASIYGNEHLDGEIRAGKGRSYGAEFLLRKNTGKLTGWLSYTYSRTFKTIDEINFGKEYRSAFDRPHNFVAVLSYDFSKRFNVSVNWVYNTGQPVTYPYGKYTVEEIPYAIYSGERNMSRYPDYHRLDIAATLKTTKRGWKKWEGEWNFSVYNLYGRQNTWAVIFTPDENNTIKTEQISLFSFVPSVSYNFKF
jgi:outer membrane cobalamin receptor